MKDALSSVDLIVFNGNIRTQDDARPRASALAVSRGRIVAVGADDEVRSLAGSQTELLDLQGRLVLPGMMDSHAHYYDWAMGRRQLGLSDAASFQELLRRVGSAARDKPYGDWILGQGWNEAEWPENRMPERSDLDAAASEHPVILWRCDLHLAAANSKALERAGIHASTPDPPEGAIARDESGEPTGILRESAINLVKHVITPPEEEEVVKAMRDGIPVLHSLGLTGIHDVRLMGAMEWPMSFRVWQILRERGELELRCWAAVPGERLDEAVLMGVRTGFGNGRLRIGHVKFYADGGMGARSAWMIEPYLDGGTGMPLMDLETLEGEVWRADAAGLAVMIHAIGDRANREVVDIFEKIEKSRKRTSMGAGPAIPHRMEHVQMIRPEDLKRLGALNVAASVQPANMVLDINLIDECVGFNGRWTYAFRDLMDAGVDVLFSSDSPVCDLNPMTTIHAAVTRQREDGTPEGGWHPRQRVTVDEAVRAYTMTPALTYGVGHELGSLTAGKRADLIVLDRDIYAIDAKEILDTRVQLTVFDGRIVHRDGW